MNNIKRLVFSCGFLAAVALLGPVQAEPLAKAKKGDWTMWGGSPDRNMVSGHTGIPFEWNVDEKKNIKWVAPLGSQTYGNPVVVNGKIFVGTNNNAALRPKITGDKGVIVCVEEKSGKFLYQITHDKMPTGRVNDWPEQGICSAPAVIGDRMWYVSNRCEVVCADVEGFLDGENDGPYKDEKYNDKEDGDIVWQFDMFDELEVFPHNLATSSPVIADDLVFVITANGVDEGHLNLPNPDAPDFLALHKDTGKIAWEGRREGGKVLHGQWSSPSYAVMGGVPQVVFAAGDGWVYSYEPKTGKLLWKFDMNPKDAVWILGGRGTRNYIIGTPVLQNDRVHIAVGQDPEHGEGIGHMYAIDATKRGDITETGKVWHVGNKDFNRTLSTVAIADGLLYASDLSGFLYCFDANTGERHWRHDLAAAVWGSPFVVDGKVMIGDEDGEVHVLEHGKTLKELAVNDMKNSVYTTPVVANGTLYITNRKALFAIEGAK